MCGIVGFVRNPSADLELHSIVSGLASAIAHRGPDDEGYVLINRSTGVRADFSGSGSAPLIRQTTPDIDQAGEWVDRERPDLALGHRRFAIISPTPDGHQPFWDAARSVCLAFNGEIYNYLELRNELKSAGREFRTETDTEVLAQAYLQWGKDCFEKLNGMWAAAIYDFARKELVLSRDRTGERPLYWVRGSGAIWFASEIKALIGQQAIAGSVGVNDDSVYNFLYQAGSDFDRRTFFSGIESVPAATVVTIGRDNSISTRKYWSLPQSRLTEGEAGSVSQQAEELRNLLEDSVRLRLRADVPVNIALSGGADSSSLVAMAARLRGTGLDTYTVRFKEREWNEWPYARAVAEMYNVRNFVAEPLETWTWLYLERFVKAMEEPFHAPDLVPDHAVRHMLARQGIKVSLSGIGGDELFSGYGYHRRFRALDLKRDGHLYQAFRTFVLASDTSPASALWKIVRGRVNRLWTAVRGLGMMSEAISGGAGSLAALPETCEERLRADFEWSLLPYWLRAGDKSSMAVPIEVRYPFLDHRLVEFAARLPISYLIRDGWMKWILRKSVDGLLPPEVVWRRKKMGFPFPIMETLTSGAERLKVIFEEMDNPYLPKNFWVSRLDDAIRSDPWLVWRALSVELWHRHFIRKQPVLPDRLREQPGLGADEMAFCAA